MIADPRRIPHPRRIDIASTSEPTWYAVLVDLRPWGHAQQVPGGFLIWTPDRTRPRKRHPVHITDLRATINDLVLDDRRRHRLATPRATGAQT